MKQLELQEEEFEEEEEEEETQLKKANQGLRSNSLLLLRKVSNWVKLPTSISAMIRAGWVILTLSFSASFFIYI